MVIEVHGDIHRQAEEATPQLGGPSIQKLHTSAGQLFIKGLLTCRTQSEHLPVAPCTHFPYALQVHALLIPDKSATSHAAKSAKSWRPQPHLNALTAVDVLRGLYLRLRLQDG